MASFNVDFVSKVWKSLAVSAFESSYGEDPAATGGLPSSIPSETHSATQGLGDDAVRHRRYTGQQTAIAFLELEAGFSKLRGPCELAHV